MGEKGPFEEKKSHFRQDIRGMLLKGTNGGGTPDKGRGKKKTVSMELGRK